MQHYTHYLVPALLAAVIVYRRVKRTIGFQKFLRRTLIVRTVLYCLVILFLLFSAAFHPFSYLTDAVGLCAGIALSYWAVKHTVFEKRDSKLFYRTHPYIEISILILFLGRFVYRFVELYSAFQTSGTPQDLQSKMQALRDPYTGTILFTWCTYHIIFYGYVMKKAEAAQVVE